VNRYTAMHFSNAAASHHLRAAALNCSEYSALENMFRRGWWITAFTVRSLSQTLWHSRLDIDHRVLLTYGPTRYGGLSRSASDYIPKLTIGKHVETLPAVVFIFTQQYLMYSIFLS